MWVWVGMSVCADDGKSDPSQFTVTVCAQWLNLLEQTLIITFVHSKGFLRDPTASDVSSDWDQ